MSSGLAGPLAGRVAVVTAAAGAGIGQEVAWRLARSGLHVAVTDRHAARAAEVAARMQEETGRRMVPVELDVLVESSVDAAVELVLEEFGAVDVLVNNAGIGHVGSIWDCALEDWHRVIDVNLTGTFLAMRAVLPGMIDRRRGSIVNITSIAGWVPWAAPPGEGAYAAAKAGVMSLTRTTAREVAAFGVRVNGVAPGLTPNPFLARSQPQDFLDELHADIPLGRANTPTDIADCVHFLAGDESRNITGETVNVSGGLFMRP